MMSPIWKLLALASILAPQVLANTASTTPTPTHTHIYGKGAIAPGSESCSVTFGTTLCIKPTDTPGCNPGYGLVGGQCMKCNPKYWSAGLLYCADCQSTGLVATCDPTTGFATSCIAGSGIINNACVKGITTCNDQNAALCSPAGDVVFVCKNNYSVNGAGICEAATFARFSSLAINCDTQIAHYNIGPIGEASCVAKCTTGYESKASNLGIMYDGYVCYCLGQSCVPATVGPNNVNRITRQGAAVAMVGSCASYPDVSTSCQTVTYPAIVTYPSNGCIASDNTPCTCINSLTCSNGVALTCITGTDLVNGICMGGITTGCVDNNAATCSSVNPEWTFICKPYYFLVGAACQPGTFARFPQMHFDCDNINHITANSELKCAQGCMAQNAINGPYQGLQYAPDTGCYCFGGGLPGLARAKFPDSPGYSISLVGDCSQYVSSMANSPCQTIDYLRTGCATENSYQPCTCVGSTKCSASTGIATTCSAGFYLSNSACVACDDSHFAVAGSAVCAKCTDKFSVTCDATTGLSLTCVQYYSAVAGVCQPSTFARLSATQFYCAGGYTPYYYGIKSELLCSQKCASQTDLNGKWFGTQWNTVNAICLCLPKSCLGPAQTSGSVAANTGVGKAQRQQYFVSVVGVCSDYPLTTAAGSGYNCQTVTYPSTGCIAGDGSKCQCLGSKVCDGITGVSTTCLNGFTLVNGSCNPN